MATHVVLPSAKALRPEKRKSDLCSQQILRNGDPLLVTFFSHLPLDILTFLQLSESLFHTYFWPFIIGLRAKGPRPDGSGINSILAQGGIKVDSEGRAVEPEKLRGDNDAGADEAYADMEVARQSDGEDEEVERMADAMIRRSLVCTSLY
jgi:hypothetical protein